MKRTPILFFTGTGAKTPSTLGKEDNRIAFNYLRYVTITEPSWIIPKLARAFLGNQEIHEVNDPIIVLPFDNRFETLVFHTPILYIC